MHHGYYSLHRTEMQAVVGNDNEAVISPDCGTYNCQHFVVVHEQILWYGSMNLLSRDDVEDNIMRLESREVAQELLGMGLT